MSHRSLLARATEGTDAPTPGYLYVDLAKIASSNLTACQDMANYLTRRLAAKQNPNIKFKCCKTLAKLCDAVPRNNFRRCVAQDHEGIRAIKEAMNFRGMPDPVRGDEPNQKVRIAAKEALDAVYRETPSSRETSSIGGTPASASYYSNPNASTSSSMQGIGNPRFSDPRLDPRYNGTQPQGIQGVVREVGEVIGGMIRDPLARNIEPPPPRQGHAELPRYGGPQNGAYGRPPPGSAELSRQTGGEWTMASNRGPAAIRPDEYAQQQQQQHHPHTSARSGGVGGTWGAAAPAPPPAIRSASSTTTPSITINHHHGASAPAVGAAVSDGTYEKNLIHELCPPGGMKPVPPPDKLANFARVCATLNSDKVCPVLLDCLEDGQPWVIRAKALCAMETAIANGTHPTTGQNPYVDFFHACREEIVPLANHPRTAIAEPAQRVLALLGVDTSETAAVAHQQQQSSAPNLLDWGDDEDNNATTNIPPPPSQAPPPPPRNDNMFGGMQVKAKHPHTTVAKPPVAAPPPPTNLLDFDEPTPGPSNQSSEKEDEKKSAGGDTTATTSLNSDMFSQLSLKDATVTPSDNKQVLGGLDAVTSNGSGSAFGFINEAPKSPTQGAKAASSFSFDPLKGSGGAAGTSATGTPNASSSRKITAMQMSPEQMQALAYQQMMMQQQMQQMQMAMAMQQHLAPGVHHPPGMPLYPHPTMPHAPVVRVPSGGMPPQFSFQATKPAQKDDKKFDFVKDAMQTAKK